jgi:hypothetical protein
MTSKRRPPRVVRFYLGGLDDAQRTLDDVLAMSDAELEQTHDYVQWLFPLSEESAAVPSSPVLSLDEVEQFRSDVVLRSRFQRALGRMLAFYGLGLRELSEGSVLERLPTYAQRSQDWLRRPHNFKRLTRILKCLRLLGFEREAQALYLGLKQVYVENPTAIGATSFGFWSAAVD